MPLSIAEKSLLRQVSKWREERRLSPEDPLTQDEVRLMILADSLLCERRAEEIRLNPPITPEWVQRIDRNLPDPPLDRFRPLAQVLSEENQQYIAESGMGSTRGTNSRIAFCFWKDMATLTTRTMLTEFRAAAAGQLELSAVRSRALHATLFLFGILFLIGAFRLSIRVEIFTVEGMLQGATESLFPAANVLQMPSRSAATP